MKALDVVSRLSSALPLLTESFTRTIPIASLSNAAGIVTAACLEKHTDPEADVELEPGDAVVIFGSIVPIVVSSLVRSGTTGTAVLATKHDLTPATAKEVTFSGATESEFVGTFKIIQILDNLTIKFTMADAGPTVATGSPVLENGESQLRMYDGVYVVLETPTDSSFTFAHSNATLPDPIGTIQARVKPKISATATVERVIEVYTEQRREGLIDLWAFVVLEEVFASKSRAIRSDATDNLQPQNFLRQQVIQPLSVYVMMPSADSVAGRPSRDLAEDLFRPICQSLLGAQFDSGLHVGKQGPLQFVAHGTHSYDSATYVHRYSFEQVVDLYFEDSVGPALDVAFECIDLTMTPTFPASAGGTADQTLKATPTLDEPADGGFSPQIQSLHLNSTATLEVVRDQTEKPIGIANTWSLAMWSQPKTQAFTQVNGILARVGLGLGSPSQIRVGQQGGEVNDPISIAIHDSAGTAIKKYQYESVMKLDQWLFTVFTWNGTDLLAYFDGALVARTAFGGEIDGSGTMTDDDRAVSVGASLLDPASAPAEFYHHSMGLWDVVLSAAEVAALHNSGKGSVIDWNSDAGAYVSSDDLQHWWRLGLNPTTLSTICFDYVDGGSIIDLSADAVEVTRDDLVLSAP